MTPQQAIDIIQSVLRGTQGTYSAHVERERAVQVVRAALDSLDSGGGSSDD